MTIKELETLSHSHPILVYDGVCVLCNRFISFVNDVDKNDLFRFATLQGEDGLMIKDKIFNAPHKDTVILIHQGEYKVYSSVSFHVFYLLGYPYKILYPLIYIPSFIRDWVYGIIAKNRYNWFGKTETCNIPEKSFRDKILS